MIYHWSLMLFPLLLLGLLLINIIRMIISGGALTLILWYIAMAIAAYYFMFLPALDELRNFRKEEEE